MSKFATNYDVGPPPPGKFWQWVDESSLSVFLERGWTVVEGIERIASSVLIEKDRHLVDATLQAAIDQAEQNEQDAEQESIGAGANIITESGEGHGQEATQIGSIGEGASSASGEPEAPEGTGSAGAEFSGGISRLSDRERLSGEDGEAQPTEEHGQSDRKSRRKGS